MKRGRLYMTDPFAYPWCRSRDLNPDGRKPLPPQDSVSTMFHHFGIPPEPSFFRLFCQHKNQLVLSFAASGAGTVSPPAAGLVASSAGMVLSTPGTETPSMIEPLVLWVEE